MLDFKCAGCGMTRDNARSAGAYRPDVFGEIFVLCTICEYSIAKHYIVRTANVATLVAAKRAARKAAKNLYMWRTFGDRRKWNENRFSRSSCGRYPMRCGKNDWVLINANDTLYLNGAHGLRNVRHDVLAALREPSGFLDMSRVADRINK